MKRGREFDNILDECLECLLARGEELEQCLASYPEQAAELKPLLETALVTKQASAIEPRPEFKARARYLFHSALQETEPRRRFSFFSWWPSWVTVMAIVLVLVLAGGGTVAAASGSMPDEPLYPVKIASEQTQLIFTLSALSKAELYANLVDKRVSEIIYVANKGDARQVELATQRLNNYLTRIVNLALAQRERSEVVMAPAPAPAFAPDESTERGKGINIQGNGSGKLRRMLALYAVSHPARLRAILQEAPESAKPALRQAITISVAGYEKALKATGG